MNEKSSRFSAFTVKYRRVVDLLESSMIVRAAGRDLSVSTFGFWDTGSNVSVISKTIAEELKPKLMGYAKLRGVTGLDYLSQYLIDIELPNGLVIKDLEVSESLNLGRRQNREPYGCLIGMDVIQLGDFALNHADGYTTLSFRTPSLTHVDYVEEYKQLFPDDPESPMK